MWQRRTSCVVCIPFSNWRLSYRRFLLQQQFYSDIPVPDRIEWLKDILNTNYSNLSNIYGTEYNKTELIYDREELNVVLENVRCYLQQRAEISKKCYKISN